MAKICAVCGREMGFFIGKLVVKDGEFVCTKCWTKAGFNTLEDLFEKAPLYTSADIIKMLEDDKDQKAAISSFIVTSDICPSAKFNDDSKQMILADDTFVYFLNNPHQKKPEYYTLFSYDQIVSFELLENGESVASGGIGRAALGGLLFGGVGAVVGAATRSYKGVCEELKIKVTVKDYKDPAFYIPLIAVETKKSSTDYSERMKMAQDVMSKLQLITTFATNTNTPTSSALEDKFGEIRKYKSLFDEGIISKEEFEVKKKELLGL